MATNQTSNIGGQRIGSGNEANAVPVETKIDSTFEKHIEDVDSNDDQNNLHYNESDQEPELHARTYVALFAMFVLNGVQVLALQGPPAVVSARFKRDMQLWREHANNVFHDKS